MFVSTDKEYMLKEFDQITRKQMIVAFIFTGICASSSAEYIILRHKIESAGVLNMITEFAFVFVFIKVILYFYDNVFKRILTHS